MASKKKFSATTAATPAAKSAKAPVAGIGIAPVAAPARAAATPVHSTPVRNTPIPKAAPAPARKETAAATITQEMIATRAYEISQSGFGGSEDDNWFRAERELRGV